jgi:hypothetical protein
VLVRSVADIQHFCEPQPEAALDRRQLTLGQRAQVGTKNDSRGARIVLRQGLPCDPGNYVRYCPLSTPRFPPHGADVNLAL